MVHWETGSRSRRLYRFIALALILALFTGLAVPAQAATSRAAKVVDVKGTVTVKKAGGSKTYKAFKNMSLNQGDWISTDDKSSVILSIVDYDDEITVGQNSELYISELQEALDGKQTNLDVLSGTIYVKAKSLTKETDTFTVSTPTAIMGVRGTQFMVSVDPRDGYSQVFVASGFVESMRDQNMIYPAMQGSFFPARPGSPSQTPDSVVSVINTQDLLSSLSPEIIEAMIRNKRVMDDEHNRLIQEQKNQLERGDGNDIAERLGINDGEDLGRYAQNLYSLVNLIVKNAIDNQVISKSNIKQLVEQVNRDLARQIDLNDQSSFQWNDSLQQEREQRMQAELERKRQLEDERRQQLAGQQELLDRMKREREQLAKKNEEAAREARRQAEEEYKKRLDEQEKARFEKDRKALDPDSKQSVNPNPSSPQPSSPPTTPVDPVDPVNPNPGAPITIAHIADIEASVNLGADYVLPATVTATMSDSSTRQVPIVWEPQGDEVDPALPGIYTYEGTVDGYAPKVILTVAVMVPFGQPFEIESGMRIVIEGGIELEFNEDILDARMTVNEVPSSSIEPGVGMAIAGKVLKFDLQGNVGDVKVKFPLNPGVNSNEAGIFYKKDTEKWEYIPTTIQGGKAVAELKHFSVYGVFTAPRFEQNVIAEPFPDLVDYYTSPAFFTDMPETMIYYSTGNGFWKYEGYASEITIYEHMFEVFATTLNKLPSMVTSLVYSAAQAELDGEDTSIITVTFPQNVKLESVSGAFGIIPKVKIDGFGSYYMGIWHQDDPLDLENHGLEIVRAEQLDSNRIRIELAEGIISLPESYHFVRFYEEMNSDRILQLYKASSNGF